MIKILFFVTKIILCSSNIIFDIKNEKQLAIRPISENDFIIFNKISTLKKTRGETEIVLTNNPIFNFKGTFYPLFYYINNDYYIVSPKNENSNPNCI